MAIIDLGPGYGLQRGRTLFSMNSWNSAPVKEPWTISQSINPSIVYAGRIDQRVERLKSRVSTGVTPIGAHPYFRCAVLSFAADSSTKMSCSAVHPESFLIQSALSTGFRCAACICISTSEKRESKQSKQRSLYLLFCPLYSFQHTLNTFLIDMDIKLIPKKVCLFINVCWRASSKVFK